MGYLTYVGYGSAAEDLNPGAIKIPRAKRKTNTNTYPMKDNTLYFKDPN